ncbi:MAG: hypothetical protein GTN49_00985 [candidate division Zixibacteria bacterium]|nr:hypothetical protein [candidate division Zixibacteria bacterium]
MTARWAAHASAAAALATALFLSSCGNVYYRDWSPSYRQETIHLGEVSHVVDARSVGLAGAGRASVYGAEAAVSNPAALASLRGGAVSAGGGYRFWGYNLQPAPEDVQAESFVGSFAGSYAAGAWALAAERFAVGGALWTPHDYTYEVGGEGMGGEMKSRGALRAVGPAMAVRAWGLSLGLGADFLWGRQTITSDQEGFAGFDGRGKGYDVRASAMKRFDVAPGWRLSAAALGKKGAAVDFTGEADYDVQFPPSAGAAFSLKAYSISVHVDYLYTFYSAMDASDDDVARVIDAVARDAGWASLGAEYVTAGGAVARAGLSYRPWYIRNAASRRVDSWRYAIGGGWPALDRHGRLDVGLGYGRRGELASDGYFADIIELQATFNYFW